MKRFFQTIKLSLTSKAFYQRVLNGSEPVGFKYFFLLNILYSIIIALIFIPTVFLLTSPEAHTKFLSVIPADLVVTLDKGKTTVNQPEPYIIPAQNQNAMQKCKGGEKCMSEIPKNAVVIDTKTPFSIEQFETYNTVILVKDSMIVGKKSGGRIEIIQNPKDLQLELSRDWAANLITKYSWLAWLIPVAVLLGSMTVVYAFGLLAYLIWALIAWALLRIYGVKTTFGRSYSVILYASALFMILDILAFVITFANSNWFQFIAIALFLYYMIKKNDAIPEETKPDEKPLVDSLPAERITDVDSNNGVK